MGLPVYIYIHVCCINNWKSIFQLLYDTIRACGLYDRVTRIKCNVLSPNWDSDRLFFDNLHDTKIEILGVSPDIALYETPTINLLHEHSKHEDFHALYLHTKGCRYSGQNKCILDWVNYLIYFNICQFEVCLQQLQTFDTVGVNLQFVPVAHYSGNFWWANASYLRRLGPCVYLDYISPEVWLTHKRCGDYCSLWLSGINHKCEEYKPECYVSTPQLFHISTCFVKNFIS